MLGNVRPLLYLLFSFFCVCVLMYPSNQNNHLFITHGNVIDKHCFENIQTSCEIAGDTDKCCI